jgi:hypothetical protein
VSLKLRRPRSRLPVAATIVLLAGAWIAWATWAAAGGPLTWSGWRVGDPALSPITLGDTETAGLRARALTLLNAVGINPARLDAARFVDNVRQLRIEAVEGRNDAGRPVVSVEWYAETGMLRSLTDYEDDANPSARALTEGSVPAAVLAYLSRAGIESPSAAPQVSWDEGMRGWQALWIRMINAIPSEDFLAVWIYPGGQLQAITHHVSPVDPAPVSPLSDKDAQSIVQRFLDAAPGPDAVAVSQAFLAWRHPNDFVAPTLPDAPDPALRLVYVVQYQFGPSPTEGTGGELWVDAGNGELLGGEAAS